MPGNGYEVGAVKMRLELDGKPAEKQLKREGQILENQAGKIASGLGKTLIAGLSIKAVTAFAKKCLDLGSDLAEVQNVVDVTFTSMSDKVDSFAKNAISQFGLSETMAKQFAGTFGAMGKAFGFAEKDVYEMSTALTGLAGDVASFYNMDQEEAFSKLKAIFTGETEGLKSLGVVMTQSALDAFAMANGFGKTTAAMNEQEKVALRYRFVLDKLSVASGDFARTSGGWANQVRVLKLQFESLCAVIGEGLIAALTPAIRGLNAFMGALIKTANTFKSFVYSLFGKESQDMTAGSAAASEALGGISVGAADAADSLGDVGDAASGAGSDAKQAAEDIKRSLMGFDQITKLSDQSSSGSGGGSGGGSGSGSGGVGGLGDTASALQDTAYDVADDNGPLSKIISKLQELKNLFVGGFWEGFGDTSVFSSIEENVANIKEKLHEIFSDSGVSEAADTYINSLAENIGKVTGSLASIGATIADNITGGISKYLEQNAERIKGWFISMFNIGTEINEIIGNFTSAIAEIFAVFRSEDAKQISADLIAIFTTPIANVTELVSKFGRDVLDLITAPFIENKDKIKTAIENTLGPVATVVGTIKDTLQQAWDKIQEIYDEHIHPLFESVKTTVTEVVGIIADGYNEHVEPILKKLSEKFKEVFEDKVQPALDRVGDAVGEVFDVLKELWDDILSPFIKWVSENIMPVLATLLEKLEPVVDKTGDLAVFVGDLADVFKECCENIEEGIRVLGEFLEKLKIPEKIQTKVELIQFGWETVKNWVTGKSGGDASEGVGLAQSGWTSIASWILGNSSFLGGSVNKEIGLSKKTGSGTSAWSGFSVAGWIVNKLWGGDINKQIGLSRKTGSGTSAWAGRSVAGWIVNKLWGGDINKQIGLSRKTGSGTAAWAGRSVAGWIRNKLWGGDINKQIGLSKLSGGGDHGWNGKSVSGWVSKFWGESLAKTIGLKKERGGDVGWWGYDVAGWVSKFWGGSLNKEVGLTKQGAGDNGWSGYTVTGWVGKFLGSGAITVAVNLYSQWKNRIREFFGLSGGGIVAMNGGARMFPLKKGGRVSRSGAASWFKTVPKYAEGTADAHGTVFVAGESGPEIMGTVNGSTEILNKSQIAAAVAGGVAKVMYRSQFNTDRYMPRIVEIGSSIDRSTAELTALARQTAEASSGGNMTEAVSLLKMILALLQTMDFDVKMDGRSVKDRIVELINQNTRATGVCEIVV